MAVKIWYDVYIPGQTKFGFAVDSKGNICHHLQWSFNGRKRTDMEVRNWFINRKAEVVKVAEQIEK